MNDKRILIIGTAAAAALLIGGALWLNRGNGGNDQFAQCRAGVVAGGAGALGGKFELTDETGARVTDAQVFTKPSLLYFGYTFCPDVCPMDMARNVEAVDLLAEKGIDVTPVFITIDPARDTPDALADYATNMHPNLVALTGSDEQVRLASQAYKTFYQKQDTGDEYYLMDHSTFTYLVLPEKGFVDFFRREVTSEQMAESVACFVQAGKGGS